MSKTIDATVKWFDPHKGFGYLESSAGDIYITAKVLRNFELDTIVKGDSIRVRYSKGGENGKLVASAILDYTVRKDPASRACTATVRWYRADRGFGFVNVEDEPRDIYVHETTLRAAGIDGLREGQEVRIDYRADGSGRLAVIFIALPKTGTEQTVDFKVEKRTKGPRRLLAVGGR